MSASREFMEIMLIMASSQTLDDLLQVPGLQFLYPAPGLHWVEYQGDGLAKSTISGKVISFDPTKIQGVRVIKEGNTQEAKVDNVRPLTKEEMKKEGDNPIVKQLVVTTEIRVQEGKPKALSFNL